jgi:hypothetical protein
MPNHPALPERFVNVDAARARFGPRVDRLGAFLHRGDPLADDAVEALGALGPAGWELLERALGNGIDAIADAPRALRALFAELDRVPAWVDEDDLERGGELLLRAGPLGGIVLGVRSLVLGYASPGGNKPLIFSGRLTEAAGRRLQETSRFVQATITPGGLRRGRAGFAITVKVRLMHAKVRRMILASGRWDEARWGLPINQHDMLGTSLLFSLVVVDGLRMLGLAPSADEVARYFGLFRYSAHLIGLEPDLLPTGEHDARRWAELIAATQGPPDEDARALTHALMHAGERDAKDANERAIAARRTRLGHAFARALLDPPIADGLGLPNEPLRHAVPLVRELVARSEALGRRVPSMRRRAIGRGAAYWQRVLDRGLFDASDAFRLPERLAPHIGQ